MIRSGRRFRRDERGVTLIEFGILSVPFFTIIAAILETSLVFFSGQVLESAVQDATRLVRTGQFQFGDPANNNIDGLRAKICASTFKMFDCSKLKIKVTVVADIGTATADYPIQRGPECKPVNGVLTCDWKLTESYEPGKSGEVVMVQVYYKWPTLVRLPGFNLQDQVDGTRLLGAVRVFRNEPFGS
jgi:Flp pilus assembly protein TadG